MGPVSADSPFRLHLERQQRRRFQVIELIVVHRPEERPHGAEQQHQ
jgi:hypothetical protein